jgi:cytochrome P450
MREAPRLMDLDLSRQGGSPLLSQRHAHDPILDLVRPEILSDPHPAYSRLREDHPVFFYDPLGSWMFSRYADCVTVLRDNKRFAADWRRVGEMVPPRAINMLTLDPPEHTVLRRLFMELLRAQDHGALAEVIAKQANDLLDTLAGRSTIDFLTDFAEPLALSATCAYLGVPAPESGWASRIGRAVGAGMDAGLWPERGPAVRDAQEELAELVDGWLAGDPQQGIVGTMRAAPAAAEVDPAVLANTVRGLLFSGYSSGSKLLGSIAVALLHERVVSLEEFRAADPARAIDELVRYASPIHAVARACVVETDVGGVRVRAGQAVTLLLGAANRDPERFPDPQRVLLDRHPNPHLGFGRGPKSCIGSPFTELFVRAALDALIERCPGARAAGAPEFHPNLTLRSLARFEVTLGES